MIRTVSHADGEAIDVRAVIEDRFHNFRIHVRLGQSAVETVDIDPIRFPYTLCPAAGAQLALLEGAGLSPRMSAYSRDLDSRHQCTHQFDVTALAIALAVRGVSQRRYDIEAVDHEAGGRVSGHVERDGERVLEMEVRDGVILRPEALAGAALGSGFTGAVAALDVEMAEAALLLRRMLFIVIDGRKADSYELAHHAPPFGGCWVQQPEQNEQALRLKGRILPPDTPVARLTAGDDAYLAAM
ncbi:hypothetical protein [Sphingomonas sp. AOB5]|uniref:hypothetical protein n=1 Tax=Sphingomonas sp. AOB5 TaxID=3034017 RepID=UPI003211CD68